MTQVTPQELYDELVELDNRITIADAAQMEQKRLAVSVRIVL